ncbi:HelD family protein [Streptomyces bobili]|uniref:HelD family protein n=1 Tax=Streptomyces bobili TaxID=67280 RepID=UPI00371D2E4F
MEQRAVDHAYHCLERTRREAAELKEVAASASGKDAIDVNRAWQRELSNLDLGRNSLVFLRADVDEGAGTETFYIGRRAVFDAEHNPAVISWSAPAAVQWRLTSEQEPGDVRLLRQIVCHERAVKRYFDLHGRDFDPRGRGGDTGGGSGRRIRSLQEPRRPHDPEASSDSEASTDPDVSTDSEASTDLEASTDSGEAADSDVSSDPDVSTGPDVSDGPDVSTEPGVSNASDVPREPDARRGSDGANDPDGGPLSEAEWTDPLLDELDRARDGALHDIVETIQRDQLRLVTERPGGVLIVQGGPGTGKTAVGLHRVSWLLDNRHTAADDILVIGPSRGFLEYAANALVELGSSGVTMLDLPALWSGGAAGRDPHPVAVIKSDARMSHVLRRAVDNLTTVEAERLEAVVGGPVFSFELRRREVEVPVAELAAIAAAALSGDSPYQVRREGCFRQVVQHLTQAYVELLPGPADTDYFALVRQLRPVSRLMRRIAPELSARDVLRRLLSRAPVLAAAADGVLTPEEQVVLVAHQEASAQAAPARFAAEPSLEDLVCLDELDFLLAGRPERIYRHVVVDEAQDLTPMQARALARRCPTGSMTVLGDLAQATGPFPYQDWEELGTTLTGRDGWRVAELLTGFRVPGEVMDYVRPLGTHCAPGVGVPDSVRRTGTSVSVAQGDGPAPRAAGLAVGLASGPDGAGIGRTTAVIVPQGARWKENVAEAIPDAGLVSVLTAEEVKGLEFDHVVVVEPAAIAADDVAGPRRLYVALTRCTQSLTVVHHRPLPRWIGGPANPVPTPRQFMAQVGRRKSPHGVSGLCTRYRVDGVRCENETRRPDGWCRGPGCAGFRTAEPPYPLRSGYLGVPKDGVTETRLELPPERVPEIRITSAACGAFVVRHRGSLGEAAVELHAMLAPFLAEGRHLRTAGGWLLDLEGYRLVLDDEARAVTAYLTGHPERSYAQVAAGVPSRVGHQARGARRSALTAPEAETGPRLADDTAVRELSIPDLYVTAGACITFERLAQCSQLPDEEFVRRLREDLASDLETGRIEWVGDRPVVEGEHGQWWLRSDGRVLATVRSAGTEIYRGFAARQAGEHAHEGEPVPGGEAPQERDDHMSTTSIDGEATGAGTAPAPEPGLAGTVAARERRDRSHRAHESLRHRLLADLYEGFDDVGDSPYADAWTHGPDGTTLFDVLAEDAPTYERIREAALHLLEASCLDPRGPAEFLVVVLPGQPAQSWAAEAADRAFSVGLTWRDGPGWAGPAASRVLPDRPEAAADDVPDDVPGGVSNGALDEGSSL